MRLGIVSRIAVIQADDSRICYSLLAPVESLQTTGQWGTRASAVGPSGEQIMANRWATGLLVGLGVAGLCPGAQAQGFPGEPMPMNMAPPSGMPSGQMPMFGSGYGPGGPQMPAMAPGAGPMMPMAPGPMMGGMGDPGMPAGPMMNHGQMGPNGMPGVGLPMGATYYPGISCDNRTSCWDKIFFCEDGERRRFYSKIGYVGLKRNSNPEFPVVSIEPAFNNIDGDGDPTFGLTPFIRSWNDVSGQLNSGVQAYIGLQDDHDGIIYEIGGWYIDNQNVQNTTVSLGRLNSPYTNAPVGFQDLFGLWTNADLMQLTYTNSIYSGEINVRFFGDCWKTLDVNYLIGLRYIKLQDQFKHYTIDDDLQFGISDPTTRATLRWQGENDMFGGQVGWSLTQRFTKTWSFSWDQKIALLANAARTKQSLYRDDGFQGYDVAETTWRFAQAYETGLYLDLNAGNMRIRAGYDLKIFVGIASAQRQFNYDLELGPTLRNTADTAVYHGPSASIEFVF